MNIHDNYVYFLYQVAKFSLINEWSRIKGFFCITEAEMDKMTDEELLAGAEKEMKQAKLYALVAIAFCLAAFLF